MHPLLSPHSEPGAGVTMAVIAPHWVKLVGWVTGKGGYVAWSEGNGESWAQGGVLCPRTSHTRQASGGQLGSGDTLEICSL